MKIKWNEATGGGMKWTNDLSGCIYPIGSFGNYGYETCRDNWTPHVATSRDEAIAEVEKALSNSDH